MAEIDTSIVDVASVRLYWQKKSARCALSLLDVASKADNNDADSRSSATSTAGASSVSTSTSAPQNVSMPSEINVSLFDGFDCEHPMVLMSVSSDDSSPPPPPQPFPVDDISPITRTRKDIKTTVHVDDTNTKTSMKPSTRGVQNWPDLQTDTSMDAEPVEGAKLMSYRRATTQSTLSHTHCHSKTLHETSKDHKSKHSKKHRDIAPTVRTSDENDNESDEENQIKKMPAKHNTSSQKRSVFKERPDLSAYNKTSTITPHKYSIPNNSLLFERLERRVGKQVRNITRS